LHIILDSATIAAVEHLCVQTSTLRCSPSISPWSCPIPYLWSLSSSCVSSLIQLFPGKRTHLLLYFTLLCLPMPGQTCWGLYVDVWVYLNDLTRQVKPLLPFLVGWGVQWLQWLFITLLLVGLPSLPVPCFSLWSVIRKGSALLCCFEPLGRGKGQRNPTEAGNEFPV
jgi:hypothetical protein